MYYFLLDDLCFEVITDRNKSLDYFNKEFPRFKNKLNANTAFTVKLSSKLPDLTSYEMVDNGRYFIKQNAVYRARDMKLVDNSYSIQFSDGKLVLTIPSSLLSLRYHLLRMVYPLLRFYAARNNLLLIKSSCTSSNGNACLSIGLSGTGKTNFVLKNIKNGHKYISDTHSIISGSGMVYPLNNGLHIFARNYHPFKNLMLKYNKAYHPKLLDLWWRYFLYKVTNKSLSKIVKLPVTIIEPNETKLTNITVLGYPKNITLNDSKKCFLSNILLSINHSECFEFNRLLDILQFLGIDYFSQYWELLNSVYQNFGKKYNDMVTLGKA